MLDIITKAAANAGGIVKLADKLGIKHQSFYSWDRVPAERVLDIEELTGTPRHEIRPDIYPAPSQAGEAA